MDNIRRLILESAMDDWISDYEVQGDFQSQLRVDPATAYRHLVDLARDWIGRQVLVPGDLVDGFQPWPGSATELAARFVDRSGGREALTRPGEICWFDTGPDATTEADRLGIG